MHSRPRSGHGVPDLGTMSDNNEIQASAARSASTQGSGSALAVKEEKDKVATSLPLGDRPNATLSEDDEKFITAMRILLDHWSKRAESDQKYKAAIRVVQAKDKEEYKAAAKELFEYKGSAIPAREAPEDDHPTARLSESEGRFIAAMLLDHWSEPGESDEDLKAAISKVLQAEDQEEYGTADRELLDYIFAPNKKD